MGNISIKNKWALARCLFFIFFTSFIQSKANAKVSLAVLSLKEKKTTLEAPLFQNLREALKTRPQTIVILDGEYLDLALLPIPTFVPSTDYFYKIKNPNFIFAPKGEAVDLYYLKVLKRCDLKLFKSAMHIKACLKPYEENNFPKN